MTLTDPMAVSPLSAMFTFLAAIAALSLAAYLWRTRETRWSDLTEASPVRTGERTGEATFKTLPPLALLVLGILLMGSDMRQVL